jgi:GNAT superfamily N-acetyltransferase
MCHCLECQRRGGSAFSVAVFYPRAAAGLAVTREVRACASRDRDLVIELWARCGLTRRWTDPAADFDLALRGRGFGARMMQAAEAWLRGKGAPKLRVMVREDNAAALGFYARLGFERQSVITLERRLD